MTIHSVGMVRTIFGGCKSTGDLPALFAKMVSLVGHHSLIKPRGVPRKEEMKKKMRLGSLSMLVTAFFTMSPLFSVTAYNVFSSTPVNSSRELWILAHLCKIVARTIRVLPVVEADMFYYILILNKIRQCIFKQNIILLL